MSLATQALAITDQHAFHIALCLHGQHRDVDAQEKRTAKKGEYCERKTQARKLRAPRRPQRAKRKHHHEIQIELPRPRDVGHCAEKR